MIGHLKKFYTISLIFLLTILTPIAWWFFSPKTILNVAIIDKTVADDSYREHLGITWLLNYKKYVLNNGSKYDYTKNYYGLTSTTKESEELLPTNYKDVDVIYLADTYGVYKEDVQESEMKHTYKINSDRKGGLKKNEWETILDWLEEDKPRLLIAEYNTFASPTEEKVREAVTNYLGIQWTGWLGRYFEELSMDKNEEIPKWLVELYGDTWSYEGEGYILVNDFTSEVVVLENGEHVDNTKVRVEFTEKGQKQFASKGKANYNYWFDIVIPEDESTVLAKYEWNLTEKGKELLEDYSIPETFPAVISKTHGQATSYYFAGDYNDIETLPKFYQAKGLATIYQMLQKFSTDNFYWSMYVPMTETILSDFSKMKKNTEQKPISNDKLKINARVNQQKFEVLKDEQWLPMTIKGVNMGMGKPGHFPGEAAITEEEYYRWFQQIAEMNANTVRVYTLHPPGFYNALKRFNETNDTKIYIFHGAWINEEKLEESLDAFEKDNLEDFQEEMKTLIDVIHGNKVVKERPGHASGTYRADVSEYVIGWIIGIEWYPHMVVNTNETYTDLGEFNGSYFETKGASAFEYWLAQQMELVTTYEVDSYNSLRPMSFTNWVTTDLLDHPAEPSKDEDLVSVDPNVIYTKGEMSEAGQFASYHVYPYYPDFFNFDETYLAYKDHRNQSNSYAAYLHDLKKTHRLPLLIAEFGVPASRGLTHENPYGWNQGFHTEQEQGAILQSLYEDIMEEELLGGLVFTWQDEWFKRTWNTVDYDNPNRRPFWSNAQTNEQQFGLVSFDRLKIKLDGNIADWPTTALYAKETGEMKALYVDHDERYLYIRLDHQQLNEGYPIILLDVVPDQGNHSIQKIPEVKFKNGLEQIIVLKQEEASLFVDKYYDFFTFQYGYELKMLDEEVQKAENNSGMFTTEQYALNKSLYLPQQKKTLPFSSYDTGKLMKGNGNPKADSYNSLADYFISDEGMIELRIPWLLIHAKDPSQKEFIGDLYKDGIDASKFVEEIFIGALFVDVNENVIDTFPQMQQQQLLEFASYTWENWDEPKYTERLKESYYILQKLFAKFE